MKQVMVIVVLLVVMNVGSVMGTVLDTVLTRYISAIGGEQRLDEVMTLSLEMEVDYVSSPTVRARMYFDVAKGQVQMVITDTAEVTVSGAVGSVGWHLTQAGNELVPEGQGTMVSLAEFICPAFEYKKQSLEQVYGGVVTLDSLVAHEIVTFDATTGDTARLYFDTTSSLLVRTRKADVEVILSEYADVDGILLYHQYEVRSDRLISTTKILSATLNEVIPESIFDIPADIQSELEENKSGVPDVVVKSVSRDDMVAIYNHRLGKLNERLERFVILNRKSDDQIANDETTRLQQLSKQIGQLLKSLSLASDEGIATLRDSITASFGNFESGLDDSLP